MEGTKGWESQIQHCWECFYSQITTAYVTRTCIFMGTEYQNPALLLSDTENVQTYEITSEGGF